MRTQTCVVCTTCNRGIENQQTQQHLHLDFFLGGGEGWHTKIAISTNYTAKQNMLINNNKLLK